MKAVYIKDVAELLNRALAAEPEAMSDLFRCNVLIHNPEIVEHPTIQVGLAPEGKNGYVLSFLGLLNGIFGTATDRLAIVVDEDFYDNYSVSIERFEAYTDWNDNPANKGRETNDE